MMPVNQIPWGMALAVFLGTLPVFGVIVWNLIEVKSFRAEARGELNAIKTEITNIRERLATLEERDRHAHPILSK